MFKEDEGLRGGPGRITDRRGFWNLPIALALVAALISGVAELHPAVALAGDGALSATDATAPNIVGDSNVQANRPRAPTASRSPSSSATRG